MSEYCNHCGEFLDDPSYQNYEPYNADDGRDYCNEDCYNEMLDEDQMERSAARHEMMMEGDYEMDFADPGGRSALIAARSGNPRNLPCPSCGSPNRLTPADRARGYQCDACADRDEGYAY